MASVTTPVPETKGRPPVQAKPGKYRPGRTAATFYWMVLPAFTLFFLFHTIPVLQGFFYSFTDYAGYGVWQFVGFDNYVNLFSDERIRDSYWFTFKFALLATILTNVVALAIALGLNAKIRARNLLRGVFFIPNVLAVLIVGYIFNFIFSNSLPFLGEKLGIDRLSTSILADEGLAWIAIVIMSVWQAAAFAIILYLAGLQTIPGELYEAASIDGAGAWRQFRSITFPLIAAFFTINMVLSLKTFMMVFDQIVAMTNGGPGTSTESISLVIYRGGFQGGEFAYQSANAVIYFVVIVVLSLTQLNVLRRREVEA